MCFMAFLMQALQAQQSGAAFGTEQRRMAKLVKGKDWAARRISARIRSLCGQCAAQGRNALAKKAWDFVKQIGDCTLTPEAEMAEVAGAIEVLREMPPIPPDDLSAAFDVVIDWIHAAEHIQKSCAVLCKYSDAAAAQAEPGFSFA